jgi:hypothetical protein
MLYRRKTFSVSAIQNKGSMCAEKGHSGADSKGRCYCCGQPIVAVIDNTGALVGATTGLVMDP